MNILMIIKNIIILNALYFTNSKSSNHSPQSLGFAIECKTIVKWSDLMNLFSIAIIDSQIATYEINVTFPGVIAKAIFCPTEMCPVLNTSYQSSTFELHGGICGVDLIPSVIENSMNKLFVLSTLTRNGSHTREGWKIIKFIQKKRLYFNLLKYSKVQEV